MAGAPPEAVLLFVSLKIVKIKGAFCERFGSVPDTSSVLDWPQQSFSLEERKDFFAE